MKKENNNKNKKQSWVALLLCIILIITGIFAFLTAHDAKINRFRPGTADVRVREPDWVDENDVQHLGWYSNEENADGSYDILHDDDDGTGVPGNDIPNFAENITPGQQIDKAPYAENTGTLEQWILMMVPVPTGQANPNGDIYIGNTPEKRTKQINVTAFSTQTGYVDDENETAQEVWNAFVDNNPSVYGEHAFNVRSSLNADFVNNIAAVSYVETRTNGGGSSTDIDVVVFKTREMFNAGYDFYSSLDGYDLHGSYDPETSTKFQFNHGISGTEGQLVDEETFNKAITDKAGTIFFDENMHVIPKEQVFNYIRTMPAQREDLFYINDLNIDYAVNNTEGDFEHILYDGIFDCYPGSDGNNYYVYAYKTVVPAVDDPNTPDIHENTTTRLFTSVTLNPHIITNIVNNYGEIIVYINGSDPRVIQLPEGSKVNEATIKNHLYSLGYPKEYLGEISYNGTPSSDKYYIDNIQKGKTYKFDVEMFDTVYKLTYNVPEDAKNGPKQQKGAHRVRISSVIPERTGYEFLGWSLTPDSDTINYLPESEIYITDDVNLYAVWKFNVKALTFNIYQNSTTYYYYLMTDEVPFGTVDSAAYTDANKYGYGTRNRGRNKVTSASLGNVISLSSSDLVDVTFNNSTVNHFYVNRRKTSSSSYYYYYNGYVVTDSTLQRCYEILKTNSTTKLYDANYNPLSEGRVPLSQTAPDEAKSMLVKGNNAYYLYFDKLASVENIWQAVYFNNVPPRLNISDDYHISNAQRIYLTGASGNGNNAFIIELENSSGDTVYIQGMAVSKSAWDALLRNNKIETYYDLGLHEIASP